MENLNFEKSHSFLHSHEVFFLEVYHKSVMEALFSICTLADVMYGDKLPLY